MKEKVRKINLNYKKDYNVFIEIDGKVYPRVRNNSYYIACYNCPAVIMCTQGEKVSKDPLCGDVSKWCYDLENERESRTFRLFDRPVRFRPDLTGSDCSCGRCIFNMFCPVIQRELKVLPCERNNVAAGYFYFADNNEEKEL